jgi:hypothetical protein
MNNGFKSGFDQEISKPNFKSPEQLQSWIKDNIGTGWKSRFKDRDDFIKNYKLQSPEETLNKKNGSCQDQSFLISKELERMGYKTKIQFIQIYGKYTHTFVAYKKPKELYWSYMENALPYLNGIYKGFESPSDIVKFVAKNIDKDKAKKKEYNWRNVEPDLYKKKLGIIDYLKHNRYDFERSEY